jgi:hypothetical protein
LNPGWSRDDTQYQDEMGVAQSSILLDRPGNKYKCMSAAWPTVAATSRGQHERLLREAWNKSTPIPGRIPMSCTRSRIRFTSGLCNKYGGSGIS